MFLHYIIVILLYYIINNCSIYDDCYRAPAGEMELRKEMVEKMIGSK